MTAKNGDTLVVHYTGTLPDGREFDSSLGREPLEFVLGQGLLLPGFERAVAGRAAGETVRVTLPPEEAYGFRNDDLVLAVPRSEVPSHIRPEVGQRLQIGLEEGDLEVIVSRVGEDEVELDGNHPLAGQTLRFNIEILAIKAG
ncbi:MAG: peptidylprolyl isomerase [Desulfovibrio sp.]|jgi:peptidylprolyl isomerase|nr:peptidylprolyl isomerase [Desulfovibrio sp.]